MLKKGNLRTYHELIRLPSFLDRYEYLKLPGQVGRVTFGIDRWLNQHFYRSRTWRDVREAVLIRDLGLDLGVRDREIQGQLIVHHMNPIELSDISVFNPDVINPDFLITASLRTHNAIHYSNKYLISELEPLRRPGDTNLWKHRR